ncbi:zf-HC2 domain-containing protein [Candidatus Aminicenantes bacterium AC-708-M15]|jgi:predicted RND superfamily exporter protein|nr:zf-HC2 domain-containing protein [SCandidatus Aminicenantes bacterium Aminicenantia_JdfR_composite]MCP2596746.1 zf-HC2 domain-containing protein [Candidatus Aminicenantes bacterium AC-335-G13]MCP2604414.1 zf-HC2 domain-containing protein [Candidatus Aminicenantes bacterium AC-708-M15]MCP2619260.1 zf-HC2 domain-containing protein [Candidatus Aminicenantes bacterium AC-335-K20]MCP2620438.1 zf-HC2 domain-containing protein [Candidatus Aminicenantes bacterium AC-334-E05]
MKCEKYQKFLSDYIDSALSSKKNEKIKKHIERCSECREVLKLYQNLNRKIRDISEIELPSNYWDSYWQRLKIKIEEEGKIKEKSILWKFNWKWSFAAITVSLLIFVLVFTFFKGKRENDEIIYYAYSEQYLSSFINELQENSSLMEYFEDLIFNEIGNEIKKLDYSENYVDLNNIYDLLIEMNEEEIEIFNSEIIKELRNKGVKNEIQS